MRVEHTQYMIDKKLIPADRYRRKDAFGTSLTQERRRPDRTDVVSAQKRASKQR